MFTQNLNKFLSSLLLLSVLLLANLSGNAKDAYSIKVKVTGFADTTCYLAYYYGSKILVSDTFTVDAKGWAHFKGNEKLPGGIYLAVYPGSKYFELLIGNDNQEFTIETDTTDFVNNMKITGSPDNKLFNEYQRFLSSKSKTLNQYKNQKNTTENEDSISIYDQLMAGIEKEIKEYRQNIVKTQPNSFLASIIRAMMEPEVPDAPKDAQGNPTDPHFAYKYFKAHFWDTYDFADGRLVRTPIFNNKINYYLDNLTPKIPDSINVSADYIIEKARANKDAFRFALSNITYNYETSKIMGMDAVFVHLAQKYYLKGDAAWMDSTNLAKMTDRVNKLKHNLLGLKAPEMKIFDIDNRPFSLYNNVNAPYTLLAFWDYNCGHCKKEMPELVALHEKMKNKGLTIIGVCTRVEIDEIKKFAEEYKLPWTNLWDPYNQSKFRDLYDIYSTPTLYLLDKDKKIIAKRIAPQQVEEIINSINSQSAPDNPK